MRKGAVEERKEKENGGQRTALDPQQKVQRGLVVHTPRQQGAHLGQHRPGADQCRSRVRLQPGDDARVPLVGTVEQRQRGPLSIALGPAARRHTAPVLRRRSGRGRLCSSLMALTSVGAAAGVLVAPRVAQVLAARGGQIGRAGVAAEQVGTQRPGRRGAGRRAGQIRQQRVAHHVADAAALGRAALAQRFTPVQAGA